MKNSTPTIQGQPTGSQKIKSMKRWMMPTVTGVVGLFLGIGLGGASGIPQSDLDDANATVLAVTAERDSAREEVLDLQASAQAQTKELEDAKAEVEESRAEVEEARKELETAQDSLDKEAEALKKREEAVSGKEKEAEANTFGAGRWIVGEDIKAGTYKTTEPVTSTMCYWAITRSGSNGDDIYSNDFGTQGNHTVTLKKGQDFESQQCGSWKLTK